MGYPLDNRRPWQSQRHKILCRYLCRNPLIPAHIEGCRALSLRNNRRAADNAKTRMNTASPSYLGFFSVSSPETGCRIRNDEVVGSIPTSSTIFSITCGICSSEEKPRLPDYIFRLPDSRGRLARPAQLTSVTGAETQEYIRYPRRGRNLNHARDLPFVTFPDVLLGL